MTLNEHILNFLRDAQYRIAKLSVEIDSLEDEGSYKYEELFAQRLSISTFMEVVYEGQWAITDGYNHLQTSTWTDREILQEIEHIRYYTKMSEVPFINFTAHYPKISSTIVQSGGGETPGNAANIPIGTSGQFLRYNASGLLYADTIDPWAGYNDESITNYFQGR